ncbi:hypothetical protein E2K69_00405, partial [Escherichia coli]
MQTICRYTASQKYTVARAQWAALRDSVPMTLSEDEIARLKGINEDLSLEEVAEIYLPLSR